MPFLPTSQIKYSHRPDTWQLHVSGKKYRENNTGEDSLIPQASALTTTAFMGYLRYNAGTENKIEKWQELEVNKIVVKMVKRNELKKRKPKYFHLRVLTNLPPSLGFSTAAAQRNHLNHLRISENKSTGYFK